MVGSIDWRFSGCLNAIKDQGQSDWGWAFSATASVETAWCIANATLYSLSEQQQLDCDTTSTVYAALNYLKNNYAMRWATYPYTGIRSQC